MKKLFSSNKAAYLISHGIKPLYHDIDKKTKNVYFRFPEDEEVTNKLTDYKNDKDLIAFIQAFKYVNKVYKSYKNKKMEDEING